jgi:hypothetical protein
MKLIMLRVPLFLAITIVVPAHAMNFPELRMNLLRYAPLCAALVFAGVGVAHVSAQSSCNERLEGVCHEFDAQSVDDLAVSLSFVAEDFGLEVLSKFVGEALQYCPSAVGCYQLPHLHGWVKEIIEKVGIEEFGLWRRELCESVGRNFLLALETARMAAARNG